VFTVIKVCEDGIRARHHTTRVHEFIYMGPNTLSPNGTHLQAHKLNLVKVRTRP